MGLNRALLQITSACACTYMRPPVRRRLPNITPISLPQPSSFVMSCHLLSSSLTPHDIQRAPDRASPPDYMCSSMPPPPEAELTDPSCLPSLQYVRQINYLCTWGLGWLSGSFHYYVWGLCQFGYSVNTEIRGRDCIFTMGSHA